MNRRLLAGLFVVFVVASVARPLDAGNARGQVCVARDAYLPIDVAKGLAPVRIPAGMYAMRVDDGEPVVVLPDRGTWVRGLDTEKSHVVSLVREGKRVASTRFRVSATKPACFGLANYEGLVERPVAGCRCPRA